MSRATFKFQVRVTRYSPFRFLTLPGHSHLSQLQFLEQRGSPRNANSFSCDPLTGPFPPLRKNNKKYWRIFFINPMARVNKLDRVCIFCCLYVIKLIRYNTLLVTISIEIPFYYIFMCVCVCVCV